MRSCCSTLLFFDSTTTADGCIYQQAVDVMLKHLQDQAGPLFEWLHDSGFMKCVAAPGDSLYDSYSCSAFESLAWEKLQELVQPCLNAWGQDRKSGLCEGGQLVCRSCWSSSVVLPADSLGVMMASALWTRL